MHSAPISPHCWADEASPQQQQALLGIMRNKAHLDCNKCQLHLFLEFL